MEQAAFSMNGHASATRARLRLRQGSSARATWILEEARGGTMITIGADPTCDWQIRAAFVPARALSVLLMNGVTYVRPGSEMNVLMNGRSLDNDWSEVPTGARIDVGLARLEITVEGGAESRVNGAIYGGAAAYGAPGRAYAGASAQPANDVVESRPPWETPRAPFVTPPPQDHESASTPSNGQPHGSLFETQAYDKQAFESAAREATRGRRGHTYQDIEDSGEFETRRFDSERSQPRDLDLGYDDEGVPAVLEDELPTGGSRWWRYALAGVATGCAYGGWILLLDYL